MGRTLDIRFPPACEPLLWSSRYKGLYGGRGGAKSHFFADLLIASAIRKPGFRAVCVREYQTTLEESVKRLLDDKIRGYSLAKEFAVKTTHVETPGDGIVIFKGMQSYNADSIKSLEGYDVAWVEEAQNLSERSLMLLRPTIRTPGSELWFSWNPRDPKDPVDRLLRSDKPPDAIVVRTTYRDNPFFPDVLRKEMEWDRSRDIDKYNHVWEGGYEERSESRVFKNWKVEEFETPDDASFLFGADWGYSVDPSVLVRSFVSGRKLFIDREAYQVGCEIDHLPALFDKVPGSREWPIVADSARPETIAYLQRHGFPRLEAAVKGKDSVKEGIIFLQGFDIVVHPRCIHTADEFMYYSHKVDKRSGIVMPDLEDKKNHVIDSVRYAVERLRRGFDWQKVGMTSEATW